MKLIPPGGEGKVTVTVSTKGFGGEKTNKSVEIQTNDASQPKLKVTMIGSVETFAEIAPERAILNGKVNEPITVVVTIKPRPEYPFKVLNAHAEKGECFQYKLEENTGSGSPAYTLTIENTRKEAGRYWDNILLETDSAINPKITINVMGNILE